MAHVESHKRIAWRWVCLFSFCFSRVAMAKSWDCLRGSCKNTSEHGTSVGARYLSCVERIPHCGTNQARSHWRKKHLQIRCCLLPWMTETISPLQLNGHPTNDIGLLHPIYLSLRTGFVLCAQRPILLDEAKKSDWSQCHGTPKTNPRFSSEPLTKTILARAQLLFSCNKAG